jgi:hypothetical protein
MVSLGLPIERLNITSILKIKQYYELQQMKINFPYSKELKRRKVAMEKIKEKEKEQKGESLFEEEISLWFD